MDVVKTRLQSGRARGTALGVMRSILVNEGVHALFSGWTAAVIRGFPANTGLLMGVEGAIRLMKRALDD